MWNHQCSNHQCRTISAEPSLLILPEPSMSKSQCGTISVEPSMPDIAVTLTCIELDSPRTNRWLFKCGRLDPQCTHTRNTLHANAIRCMRTRNTLHAHTQYVARTRCFARKHTDTTRPHQKSTHAPKCVYKPPPPQPPVYTKVLPGLWAFPNYPVERCFPTA